MTERSRSWRAARWLVVLVALLALSAGACSSDDDDGDTDTPVTDPLDESLEDDVPAGDEEG